MEIWSTCMLKTFTITVMGYHSCKFHSPMTFLPGADPEICLKRGSPKIGWFQTYIFPVFTEKRHENLKTNPTKLGFQLSEPLWIRRSLPLSY